METENINELDRQEKITKSAEQKISDEQLKIESNLRRMRTSGISLTATYLVLVFFYVAFNIKAFWCNLPPNELGDFLAGVFGPLALLWLVLGYFQQGFELKLSSLELRNSVLQQRVLARAALDGNKREAIRAAQEEKLRAAAKLRLRPDFDHSVSGEQSGEEGRWVELKLRNIGPGQGSVQSISCVGNAKWLTFPKFRPTLISPGKTLSITMSYPQLQVNWICEFLVTCHDDEGTRYDFLFKASVLEKVVTGSRYSNFELKVARLNEAAGVLSQEGTIET